MTSPILQRASTLAPCVLLALLAHHARGQTPTPAVPPAIEHGLGTSPADRASAQKPAPALHDEPGVASPSTSGRALPATSRVRAAADAAPQSSAAESVPAAVRSAIHTAPDELMFDESKDGVVWTRARAFKASFDGDHATIVPFFGSEAPHNYPIVLRAHTATLAGDVLQSETPAHAVRSERTVRMNRAAFVEEYALEMERLEQRFVFDALPRRGELVMRIDVETELAVTEVGDALRFSNELGHVDYGQAFAIDAAGARIALERTFEDGTIALTVPSAFVAGAVLPLTIDPFVTFFTVTATSRQELFPDISYDASSARWCAVWTAVFSANDYDAYAKVMTAGGASLGELTIDFTSDYWTTPKIANNNEANVFLIVAAVDPAPVVGNQTLIRGRLVTPAPVTTGPQFDISPAGGTDRHLPDVGGDPHLGGASYFCVVWQHDVSSFTRDIEMQLVEPTGTLVGGVVTLDDLNGRCERPAISNSLGLEHPAAPARWTVTWQHEFASVDHDIYARQVEWSGFLPAPQFAVDTSTFDETEPSASTVLDPISNQRYALIVYQRDAGLDEDIFGALVSDTMVLTRRNLVLDFPTSTADFRQLSPKVDSDGRQFLVGHIELDPSAGFDPNVWISDYYVSGGALVPCAVRESFAGSPAPETDFALHSKASSGGERKRYFGTWVFEVSSTGYDIQGGLWDGCSGGAVTSYCFGDGSGTACPCGNNGASGNGCASSVNPAGALLSSAGDASVSADTLSLQGSGMPATATCLYFQGSLATNAGAGSVFGDGKRCASGTLIRLGTKTNSAGTSQYPSASDPRVSVRGLVPAEGATRFYQVWYRNAAAFCTSATFNLTNGLQVAWAP